MLELRPGCEQCDTDLGPEDPSARICTFECTFCARCADELLGGVCPNCSGELVPRPLRPTALLDAAPPSTERIHSPADLEAHRATRSARPIDGDHPGATLRRYVDAWTAGDLEGVLGAYAEDFTLHYFGSSEFAGVHVGRDAATQALLAVTTRAPRTLVDVEAVLVDDDGGALVVTETLERGGESATVRRVFRYRISGGLLRECWSYDEDQRLVDHVWRPDDAA